MDESMNPFITYVVQHLDWSVINTIMLTILSIASYVLRHWLVKFTEGLGQLREQITGLDKVFALDREALRLHEQRDDDHWRDVDRRLNHVETQVDRLVSR